MIKISMVDKNSFVETVMLDDTSFRLRFNWNDYSGFWTVDICDNNNVDIVNGIVVVLNFPLLQQYRRHADLPDGELLAVVNDSTVSSITRDDFINGKVSMIYIPKEEMHDILASTV